MYTVYHADFNVKIYTDIVFGYKKTSLFTIRYMLITTAANFEI